MAGEDTTHLGGRFGTNNGSEWCRSRLAKQAFSSIKRHMSWKDVFGRMGSGKKVRKAGRLSHVRILYWIHRALNFLVAIAGMR